MSLEVDFAPHLVKAEAEWAKVYPALCDGQDAKAVLALIEHFRESLNALEFLIRKNTRKK